MYLAVAVAVAVPLDLVLSEDQAVSVDQVLEALQEPRLEDMVEYLVIQAVKRHLLQTAVH